jgi:tRNA G18 (ribose-2'-O)-methylase SpoU
VAKVASGAAETVPYFMVTNLARTLNELKERNIWIIGTSDDAPQTSTRRTSRAPWRWCWAPKAMACASSRARPAMRWSASPCRVRSKA